MKSTLLVCAVLGLFTATSPRSTAAAEPFEFRADAAFVKLPDSIKLGACSGVAVNSEGHVYLFHRGKQPLICLDDGGKFIRSWGDDVIGSAHGLRIDRDDNVWVTDIGNHQVLKFNPTGKHHELCIFNIACQHEICRCRCTRRSRRRKRLHTLFNNSKTLGSSRQELWLHV